MEPPSTASPKQEETVPRLPLEVVSKTREDVVLSEVTAPTPRGERGGGHCNISIKIILINMCYINSFHQSRRN